MHLIWNGLDCGKTIEVIDWIPVKNGYPPEGVMVMCTLIDNDPEPDADLVAAVHGPYWNRYIEYEMWFKGDHWYDTSTDGRVELDEVLAWRPLHSVYKGE